MGPKEDGTFGWHALLAYCASVLLIIFVGSILQFYNLNLGFVVTEVALIAIPAAIVLRVHRNAVDGNRFLIPSARQLSLTALIGCCVVVIAVYKGIVTRKALLGIDPSDVYVADGGLLLLMVLLPPWCEELLFRPVIQSGLARQWSNRTAVIVTALLFGLYHLSLLRFTEAFVIGLFIGIVFLKTRNFWCCAAVHLICNALGPVLWRNAPHLTFMFNFAMIGTLACVALAACYFLGDTSPAPLRGLRQWLNWAAFGTAKPQQMMQIRSRRLPVLTGVIVVCLIALLGVGHAVTISQLREPTFKSNYVVSQEDEWTVISSEQLRVRSTLVIRKSPEPYEDLIVQLPFHEATLQKMRLAGSDLPFSVPEPHEYHVDLSSHQDAIRSGTITVLWTFSPATCLTPFEGEMGRYSSPLQSLVPSDSFSLAVTIAEDSGFRFSVGDSDVRTIPAFSGSSDRPKMNYGNWAGLVKREDSDDMTDQAEIGP